MQITSDALFFHVHWSVHKSRTSRNEFFTSVHLWALEEVLKTPGSGVNVWPASTACFLFVLSVVITDQTGRNKPYRNYKKKKKKKWSKTENRKNSKLHWRHGGRNELEFASCFIDVILSNQPKGSDAKASVVRFSVVYIINESTAVLIFKDAVRVEASWIIDLYDGMSPPSPPTVNTEIYEAYTDVLDKWVDTVNISPYIFIRWRFNFLGRTKTWNRWLLMYDVARGSSFEGCCCHIQDVNLKT